MIEWIDLFGVRYYFLSGSEHASAACSIGRMLLSFRFSAMHTVSLSFLIHVGRGIEDLMSTFTPTHMSVEEYLHGDHDWDVEPDYVDGELEERYLGQKDHSRWQRAIVRWFDLHREEWHLDALPELRTQTKRTNYRTPDVLVLGPDAPDEQIITHPPLAVFEVLSPDDRISRTQRKLAEYEMMGVPSIYLIDTELSSFQRYQAGALLPVTECVVGGFTFACAEIAAQVR